MSTPAQKLEPIAEVVRAIAASAKPVLAVDTCNFQDLIRVRVNERVPTADPAEVRVAVELPTLVAARQVHIVLPELVPGEWADHADARERELATWVRSVDRGFEWLQAVGAAVGNPHPAVPPAAQLNIAGSLRAVAESLIACGRVLARDPSCVEKALARLTASPKRRPSHEKEIKDSINLEQVLELARLLRSVNFNAPVCWVSSNVVDFAAKGGTKVHPDLATEFNGPRLDYFVTLQAAVGRLRADGHLPKS